MDSHAYTVNPMFVKAQSGDFHLSAGSPAIDACTVSDMKISGEKDLYGNVRMVGSAMDIGASEYGLGTGVMRQVSYTSVLDKKMIRCLLMEIRVAYLSELQMEILARDTESTGVFSG